MRTAQPVLPRVADALLIAALVVLAGLAFGPAYGGTRFVGVLAAGAAVGVLAGLVPSLARWPGWTTVPLAVLGYLACSGIAVPSRAAAGVLPTGETLRIAVVGVVASWKQMLTVAVPVGGSGALLVPAFLTSVALTTVGVLLAVRGPAAPWALLAPAVMLAVAAGMGTAAAWRPAVVGTVLAAAGLVWAGWRRRRGGLAGLEPRRPIGLALVLLPALAVGLLLGPSVMAGAERTALRSTVQPPFDPQAYPSPLSGFRKYVKAERDTALFDVAGLPEGARLRLAALDSYDGVVLGTSAGTGTFARVGDRISGAPGGAAATVTVTVDGYADVWLPTAGYLSGITFAGQRAATLTEDFRYDRGTGTGVVISGLRSGDSFTERVGVPVSPDPARMAGVPVQDLDQPDPQAVPDAVKTRAQEFTADVAGRDPFALATALAAGLRHAGYFSHGDDGTVASPAGHGADRMIRLLTAPTMVGDQEQYAVAMTLMARSLGLPARVVMGFAPHASGSSRVQVTGADVTAWVEIPFSGVGWVAFDPTPDQSKVPQQQTPDKQQNAHQQQVQPPPPPEPPERAQTTTVKDAGDQDSKQDDDKQDQQQRDLPAAVPVGLILGIGIPVIVLMLPVLAVLAAKMRRARRRRSRGSPAARIAGGWSEVLDRSTDLGLRPPHGTTRSEAAAAMDAEYGGSVAVLARAADTSVFAPEPVDPVHAESFWAQVRDELRTMEAARPRWRRWRARVSLASLRRSRRPRRSG
jgi:transglutaminase-like putative cysteine protease